MGFFKNLGKKRIDVENEELNNLEHDEDTYEDEEDESDIVEETPELIDEYKDKVVHHFTKQDSLQLNSLERGVITREEFMEEVVRFIDTFDISDSAKEEVRIAFEKFIWSYDIIDKLIEDKEISDIKIYDYNKIRIKRLGKRGSAGIQFRNREHYLQFVEHAAIKNKVSLSDANALCPFTDKTSSDKAILRFNITTKLINSNELPVMHIRKINKEKYTTQELIDFKFFNQETVDILRDKLINGEGILIAGKGAAGKTTLLNWLLDEIPEDFSGLVIQDNEETFSEHPDFAFQRTILGNGEGKIEYTLQSLARNGLLTDLDYFVIGEVKGGEALYLLNAAYTGHKCIATVHGASSTEAMDKLADYVKYASDYTKDEALQMLVHLNTVVFMKDFHVLEISEITGYDKDKKCLTYNTKVFEKEV